MADLKEKPIERIQRETAAKIIEMMERDGLQWTKSWITPRPACNGITGHAYRGSNILTTGIALMCMGEEDPRFITFKQARSIGASVRKGEKGTPIVFYKTLKREDEDTGDERRIPLARVSYLFHVSQIDDLDESKLVEVQKGEEREDHERNAAIDALVQNCGVRVKDAPAAFWEVQSDTIGMPRIGLFGRDEDYYSVLLHELTHATGHKSRLNRDTIASYGRSRADRAREELVAEIGSAMLGQIVGIQVEPDENNAAYIQSWCKLLTDRPKAIFEAAAQASMAVAWIECQQEEMQAAA